VSALLCLLVLAAPGTIRVRVEGTGATEVVAFRDGKVAARAPVADGVADFGGLDEGAYDLRAVGEAVASDVVRGVRTVHDGAPGIDAVLTARAAFEFTVKTEADASVWCDGLRGGPARLLPAGLHRVVVDHPSLVSSAERLVRLAGPVTLEVPLETGLAVVGRVASTDGEPVAGARVDVFTDGFRTGRAAFTDDAGRFGVAGFRGDVCSLEVSAAGFATRLVRVVFFPGEERSRAEVALAPGSSVSLPVPAPGATAVLFPEWYERALEEPRLRAHHVPAERRGGRGFLFHGLAPGRRYRIAVRAPGRLPGSTAVFEPEAGKTLALDPVELAPAATLAGRVAREGAGRTVVCQSRAGTLRQRADRAGRFRFDGLDAGEHVLWVDGLDERGVPVEIGAGETKADLVLGSDAPERGEPIRGIVLDADRRPLAGVLVETSGARAASDADGRFELAGLPPGPDRFTLAFRPGPDCRGLAEDPHLPHVERKVQRGAEARVSLQRAGRLWVRLDAGGRKLARARLHVASGSSDVRLQRQVPRGTTEMVIDDLPVGRTIVEVSAPGFLGTAGAVVHVEPDPEEPVVVTVASGRSVRGRVVRRVTREVRGRAPVILDEPLETGTVTLLDGDPLRALATTPIEADGGFLLEGLPAATVLLAASTPGRPVAWKRVDLTEADATGAVIAMERGVEAAIVVTGEKGEPLRGARVRVVTEHGVDVRDLAAFGRFRRVVAADEDFADLERLLELRRRPSGRISVPFLQPGSYRFHVSAEGYRSLTVGVRARTPEALGPVRSIPGVPEDWASPVRLVREIDAKD